MIQKKEWPAPGKTDHQDQPQAEYTTDAEAVQAEVLDDQEDALPPWGHERSDHYGGFVKLNRSEALYWLLRNDPNAFLVLSLAAIRARRDPDRFNKYGLDVGEALVDHPSCGLSRKEYRTALNHLEKYGICAKKTDKPTQGQKGGRAKQRAKQRAIRGTAVKLLTTDIFDIAAVSEGPSKGPDKRPKRGQQGANKGPRTRTLQEEANNEASSDEESSCLQEGSRTPETATSTKRALSEPLPDCAQASTAMGREGSGEPDEREMDSLTDSPFTRGGWL